MKAYSALGSSQPSMDVIIADIRTIQDDHIRELLRDPVLVTFLSENFEVTGISHIRKEFLKRELQELRNSALDLVHYAALIKAVRDSGNVVSYDDPLFTQELKMVFQRYV